jgi:hypothetical protein
VPDGPLCPGEPFEHQLPGQSRQGSDGEAAEYIRGEPQSGDNSPKPEEHSERQHQDSQPSPDAPDDEAERHDGSHRMSRERRVDGFVEQNGHISEPFERAKSTDPDIGEGYDQLAKTER